MTNIKRYDLGYSALQSIIRPLTHSAPLAELLLKHTTFWGGRCSAWLPDTTTDDLLNRYYKCGYRCWLNEESSASTDGLLLGISSAIKEYFDENGPDSVCLIEDVTWKIDEYGDWNERGLDDWNDVLFFGEIPYLVLTAPLADREAVSKFLLFGTSVDENPSILVQWPEAKEYLVSGRELNFEVLEILAQNCDAMFTSAFDFCSYILWERGKAGQQITN